VLQSSAGLAFHEAFAGLCKLKLQMQAMKILITIPYDTSVHLSRLGCQKIGTRRLMMVGENWGGGYKGPLL
jgi:hypothetical protein